MNPADTLRFVLDDRIDDATVGPSRVPLGLLKQFHQDVAEFLAGSKREVDPQQVMVSVQEGSLVLAISGLLAATGLWHDVTQLQGDEDVARIDDRRAEVMERWQATVRKHPHRRYALADREGVAVVRVDGASDFRKRAVAAWVPVEKYLSGQITDLGGTTKANVHLRIASGRVLTIASSQQLLAEQEQNRLYRLATLRVSAEEHLDTGDLRNLVLMGFEDTRPTWDEAQFDEMVQRGTAAWKDVPDDWLETLRSDRG
ncbi:MAG: hypothetical protein ACXIUZ_11685 [Lysobacteraceae bacterium]